MYQPYPSGGQEPVPQQRPPAPQSVLTAVKLMYAGAALSAIGIILNVVARHSLRSAILKAFPHYTATQVHRAETAFVVIAVVEGLIGIGLWVWMALANGRGHSWARILGSVFFALDTLFLLLSVARTHSALSLVFEGLVWLAGLGATVLLWRKESSAYFQSR